MAWSITLHNTQQNAIDTDLQWKCHNCGGSDDLICLWVNPGFDILSARQLDAWRIPSLTGATIVFLLLSNSHFLREHRWGHERSHGNWCVTARLQIWAHFVGVREVCAFHQILKRPYQPDSTAFVSYFLRFRKRQTKTSNEQTWSSRTRVTMTHLLTIPKTQQTHQTHFHCTDQSAFLASPYTFASIYILLLCMLLLKCIWGNGSA